MAEPKIRFKGYNDEWVVSSYCEIAKSFKYGLNACAISFDGMNKYLRITDIDDETRCFIQSQLTTPGIDLSFADEYLLQDGDITFARTGASVGKSYIYHKYDGKAYFAGFLIRMQTIDSVSPDFIFQNSLTSRFLNHIKIVSQRSGQPGINTNELKAYELLIPDSLAEQQQIASCFKSLDTLIQSATKKIASLKQLKSASLISMFPQEGEVKPRVRFKGFKEDWKNVSFIDITYRTGIKNGENLPLESYSISNEFGFIPQNEQFENGGTMFSADKRMYYIVSPKSFAYNPARINVGSLGYYNGKKEVIVSSLYEVFKTNDLIEDQFLLCWFKTDIFQKMIEQYQEGGVRLYFFYDKLCKCTIKIPSLQEQRQIASFFCSLDKQISLETQRLDKFKQIKSACLDKMFV